VLFNGNCSCCGKDLDDDSNCVVGAAEYESYVDRPKAELDKASKQINEIQVIVVEIVIDKVSFIVGLFV
jgi:hypothetical protein